MKPGIAQPELVWPGKYDEHGNRVVNRGVVLPFQVVVGYYGRLSKRDGNAGYADASCDDMPHST